jgi:hypothetical protein
MKNMCSRTTAPELSIARNVSLFKKDLEKMDDENIQGNIHDHSFFRSSTFKKHLNNINEKKISLGCDNNSHNTLETVFMLHSGGIYYI